MNSNMKPEEIKAQIEKTKYGQSGKYTAPVALEITKSLAPRAGELMAKCLSDTCDIVFAEFLALLKDKSNHELIQISARWGTEFVMQSIEVSKKIKEHAEIVKNNGTN